MKNNVYLKATIVTNPGKKPVAGPMFAVLEDGCHLAEMQPDQVKAIGSRLMAAMAKDAALPYDNYYVSMHEVSEREYLTETGALEEGDESIINELANYETTEDVSDLIKQVSKYARMLAKSSNDNDEFRRFTRLATILDEAAVAKTKSNS